MSSDNFNINFVISKTRISPFKKLTLPHLELMGAIISARIDKHLREIFKTLKKLLCGVILL